MVNYQMMNTKIPKRIIVAMSGGVDSSVAAALLKEKGYEVIGITLKLWRPSFSKETKGSSCCSINDINDAKRVCDKLGIAHYIYNLEDEFQNKVVDDFVTEYFAGKTPNPCVRCNLFIKFDLLFEYAMALGADYLATGHYARITRAVKYRLCKAADPSKDQSYFLYMLNQTQLSRLLFPLGDLTKTRVREIAQNFGLATADKDESMDVCFLEGRDYREFLAEKPGAGAFGKGLIKMRDGKILGEHNGLHLYTIGQRDNLGVSLGHRLYVLEKNTKENCLVVGKASENITSGCTVNNVNWCNGVAPARNFESTVKIRYRHKGVQSRVIPSSESEAVLEFLSPQGSITPGQSAVFYAGDEVLGGGIIQAPACVSTDTPSACEQRNN